ncbi:uncharacterized protein PG998_008188 [Apiospora kogelbergensis]|uniref:uncharacterized protein n=1 Tax=Apiospora kogelbergensis TaxID=1337665 RepID=UPI00312FABC6
MSAPFSSCYQKSHPRPNLGLHGIMFIRVWRPSSSLYRPSTPEEMYLLRDVAVIIRRDPRTVICDVELEDITSLWLQYLNGLHNHLEAYPVMQQARHASIAHWRGIIHQLHYIIQRAASQCCTALDTAAIFPDHMLGGDWLSPLEQARLAIIKLSEARFGDWLAGLGNWAHQPQLIEPSFWMNGHIVRWTTDRRGDIQGLFGELDIRFLEAIDFLNQHGGDESFLVTNVVAHLDSSLGSPSDYCLDIDEMGYLADEEDFDEEDADEPLSPEDHRRSVGELLAEMLRDVDAMIDAVPKPEPKETPELRDVEDDDNHKEPEWIHDQDYSNNENESSDTGTVIHTPQDPEPEEPGDGEPSDDDPSDDSGSEGEQQEEQPDGPWIPVRQPFPAQHSLYSFQSWHEAFIQQLPPIFMGQQLQPPIQRPVIAAPAPAPEPAPAEPQQPQQQEWDHIVNPILRMVDLPNEMPPTPTPPGCRPFVGSQANIGNADPWRRNWGDYWADRIQDGDAGVCGTGPFTAP